MKNALTVSALVLIAASAQADVISGLVTADNHYALYAGDGTTAALIGRNEMGAGGAPGTYNWSRPESWAFNAQAFLYIVAWSDDSVAQGVLAQLTNIDTGDTYNSGDPRWQVYATFTQRGDGSAEPSVGELMSYVLTADAGDLWQTPVTGGLNGVNPWGTVPGIGGDVRWMWVANPGQSNALIGGSGYGETLVFRMAVPAPGAAAALGLGGLAALRRPRR
ncbi:MAG: hypothetical protein K2Q09_04750 [Phycisphaerales bacterium]|nr:hypothetical protein [Phycisphaerales bacterium]